MVKTHLPAHMDSVRQKWRPKHQLLILKCYPRLPKNSAADVKPNASELSYLLFYASTRRSKLQKVGSFLERKTASDIYRWQSARVLVTLQILTALLENKSVGVGSGFILIAPYVLRIIAEILQSTNDISLIEGTLDTWEVFCQHQDQATLKADHEYRELYQAVVKSYADFAHKESNKKIGKSTNAVAIQDAIRLRQTGLGAIKSVLLTDALASESGRQLNIVVPAILSNLEADNEHYLVHVMRMSKQSEAVEKEKAINRRMSMSANRTYTGLTEGSIETDPRQAAGTAQDADELAEEEVAVLAMDCVRAVFANENRSQVRSATSAVLNYLSALQSQPAAQRSEEPIADFGINTWATRLFEICTAWTPVQDRFILMVTTVETLGRLSLKESDLPQQLLYTHLVHHVLRSDLNLIGLSVMDILLGLIQQMLRVLQLDGPRAAGRSSATQLFSSDEDVRHPTPPQPERQLSEPPSAARIRLIERLKHCIADLGTHVYYTDQIADMISAILFRLKPNPAPAGMQNPLVTAAAIEEPKAALNEVASNISLSARERPNTSASGFFSFETARQIALQVVRDILNIANSSRPQSTGGLAESRYPVPITIWEGTQWLLRDPAPAVRKAYIDALTTWLNLETKKADMRVQNPKDSLKKKSESAITRRAVSNASNKKDEQNKKATSTFLQLLHLAVYENTLQFAVDEESEGAEKEILVLHYLLSTLVQRLGVNAVTSGLPMIFALQEEIGKSDSAVAKVRIGSLVHGYFWVLSEVFDFDTSSVAKRCSPRSGREEALGYGVEGHAVPAMAPQQVFSTSATSKDTGAMNVTAIKPFSERQGSLIVSRSGTLYPSRLRRLQYLSVPVEVPEPHAESVSAGRYWIVRPLAISPRNKSRIGATAKGESSHDGKLDERRLLSGYRRRGTEVY